MSDISWLLRPRQLQDLIDRHKTAAAAFDSVCRRLDQVEQVIARKYPAEICRSWLRDEATTRKQWLKVRRAHGVALLERDRRRLDEVEKDLALELLARPCRTIEEARLKAGYIKETDIVLERLSSNESSVNALLQPLMT